MKKICTKLLFVSEMNLFNQFTQKHSKFTSGYHNNCLEKVFDRIVYISNLAPRPHKQWSCCQVGNTQHDVPLVKPFIRSILKVAC